MCGLNRLVYTHSRNEAHLEMYPLTSNRTWVDSQQHTTTMDAKSRMLKSRQALFFTRVVDPEP